MNKTRKRSKGISFVRLMQRKESRFAQNLRKASFSQLPFYPGRKSLLSSKEIENLIKRVGENDASLTSLEIGGQKLTNSNIDKLFDAIESNESLTHIDISNNGLLDMRMIEFFHCLLNSNNRVLRTIDISMNGISAKAGKDILKFLQYRFHISSIKYNDRPPPSISEAGFSCAKVFDIKPFSDKLILKIESELHSNRRLLMFLNGMTTRFECRKRKVRQMSGILRVSYENYITSLDFTNNQIVELNSMIGYYTLLQELIFPHNRIVEIPSFLAQLVSLRVIDLSYNKIETIPDSLRALLKLETLALSHNSITEVPLFLCTLPSLSFLAISNNPITTFTEELLLETERGSPKILNQMRQQLETFLDGDLNEALPDDLSKSNLNLITILRKRKEVSPIDFAIRLPCKSNEIADKFVCRDLSPAPSVKCNVIKRIGEAIWCGLEDGSISVWDARTVRLIERKENVLDDPILDIVDISALGDAWVCGNSNVLSILSTAQSVKKTNESESQDMQIFLDAKEFSLVTCMIFVEITNRVWLGCSNCIVSYCAQTKEAGGSITMDAPILSMVYHSNYIWTGCGDGNIYLLTKSGKTAKVFSAFDKMIFGLYPVGPFVWSSSVNDELKVWTHSGSKDIHCIASVEVKGGIQRMVSPSHGESIYCVSSNGIDILEFSPTGKLLTVFGSSHKEPITALGWSQSPDRLWTSDGSGALCYHELKMGKKTLEKFSQSHGRNRTKTNPVSMHEHQHFAPIVPSLSPSPEEKREFSPTKDAWSYKACPIDKERKSLFSPRYARANTAPIPLLNESKNELEILLPQISGEETKKESNSELNAPIPLLNESKNQLEILQPQVSGEETKKESNSELNAPILLLNEPKNELEVLLPQVSESSNDVVDELVEDPI